jgi:pyruvate formate lyase activating enzyme
MLTIFNIQRYSLHDGDGIRTNIFFKGCPLRCLWCNNPEGIDPSPVIMFDERSCYGFGECIKAGDGKIYAENGKLIINRDQITDASVLDNICPSKALVVTGLEKSVTQILQEIERDIPFYQTSGGGVTLTGGEPLAQGPELKDLISELKKRTIHLSVETSLHLPWEKIEEYSNSIDLFLADLKHVDIDKFTRFTGGDATLVMNNFLKLDMTGRKFIVRIPVIPLFNFSTPELFSIIDFVAGLKNAYEIDLIPYHSLAREKYLMTGMEYLFGNQSNIEKDELKPFVKYAEQKGLIAKIMN